MTTSRIRANSGSLGNPPPPIYDGSLTSEQVDRAAWIADSRSIDLETAQELVYLRDQCAANAGLLTTKAAEARQEAFKEGVEIIRKLPDHPGLCGVWLQQVCDCSFRTEAIAALKRAAATDKQGEGINDSTC